jgi:hypothetical protein
MSTAIVIEISPKKYRRKRKKKKFKEKTDVT